jgi:hypothetical protein
MEEEEEDEDDDDEDGDDLSDSNEHANGGTMGKTTHGTSSRGKNKSSGSAGGFGGKWSTEEDNLLREIVEKHGAKSWKKVATLLGSTRTDVQCLHRWNKVLKVR